MEKITKSFLALVLMFVGMVSALAQPVAPKAPEAPAAPKASAFVTDGSTEQYLYNVEAKGFFIGANDWGTRASFSAEKGYKVRMAVNADGQTYTFNNEAKGGNSADCQGVDQIWVDGAGRAGDGLWTVTVADDGSFKLGNTNVAGFLSVLPSKNDTKLYMSDADEAQSVWIAVSEEDYAAYLEAVPAYQAALKEYNDAYAQYQIEYAAWLKENYKAGDELAILAPATWAGQGGTYGGLANPSFEKYNGGSLPAGEVMTQTIEGLKNGKYNVKVEFAGSFTSGRGFECPTGDDLSVAFANDQEEILPVVDRTWVGEGQQNFYNFQNVEVTDGTLKYGIKNVADAGNWYVARLASITMVPEPEVWYNENTFCYKDAANGVSRSMELPWVADPDDAANGCITLSSAAGAANDHDLQFMIRGAEYDGADLMKGAFSEGVGYRVSFRVKADGNYSGCAVGTFYSIAASGKDGWKFGAYTGEKLNVTTEWQTVSFTVIASSSDAGKLTAIGFNLADNTDKQARTFYFDDVRVVRGDKNVTGSESVVKVYNNVWYKGNGINELIKSDDKGNYIEVVSPAKAEQDWDSQIFISIPEEFVGKQVTLTMDVKASAAVSADAQLHKSNDGNGYTSAPAGDAVPFTTEWATISRTLDTSSREVSTWWGGKELLPNTNTYVLNLTKADETTYGFKNISFAQAQEDWYVATTPTARTYEGFTEEFVMADGEKVPYKNSWEADGTTHTYNDGVSIKYTKTLPEFAALPFDFKDSCIKIKSNDMPINDYDCQFFIKVSDTPLKKNQIVTVSMKVKTDSETEVSVGTGVHFKVDGWTPNASDALTFKVGGDWQDVVGKFDVTHEDLIEGTGKGGVWYALSLSDQKSETAHNYWFDDIKVTVEDAPVLDWVDLIPLQDFEAGYTGADDEPIYFLSKENVIAADDTHRSRIVEGAGKDSKNGIEFRTQGGSANWDSQFEIRFPYQLPNGTTYKIEFDYMVNATANFGTQSWDGGVGSYATGGTAAMKVSEEEIGTWKHYSEEYKVNYTRKNGDEVTSEGLRWDVFDMAQSGQPNAIVFIDNISVKVPAGTLPFKDAEGNEIAPDYLSATEYPIYTYIDPTTLDWTDNLFTNGDIEGEDMSAFIAKVNDDADALLLPAGTKSFKGSNQILVKTIAREKDPADETKYLGNDHDTQFFVRLPYALAKGTKYYFSVDVISNKVVDVQSQTHAEPGQWKSNTGVGKISVSSDALTVADYFVADNDMRTIAFNLASATEGGMFYFDNFVFKVVKDEEADIQAFTATWDETSTWNETFALNQAVDAGRTTEIEGKGYTEESVKALTDAIAAGKAQLNPAEGADPVTKETLAAATKAIEDAIAGLTTGAAEELLPKPELGADFIEIAQDQGKTLDEFTRTDLVEGEDYNTYTAHGDLNIALKMMPVDVEGCDYVVVYFATPAPEGWKLAFWNNQDLVDVPAGATEFKYVFAEDPKCDVKDGVLPQICMMTFFGAPNPLEAKIYGIYKHKVPAELAYTDLTPEMFFQWTDWTDAEPTASAYCEYKIDEASGQPYGDPSVNNYADLSEYATLEVTATAGSPRFLFNRDVAEGQWSETEADSHLIDNTKGGWSAKYFTSQDNGDGTTTYIVDIAAIVADKGFAHLMAIKGANWADVTVTEMKLGYVGEQPALPVPTNINGVEDGESVKDGKYFINGQIVIVKNGVKYNAAGVAIQ